jgi:chromate reductase, NAD(P)H dehydrogenase (quinone)
VVSSVSLLSEKPGDYCGQLGDPMIEYRVAVVIGSLRRESYNRKLANAVKKLAPEDFSFHDLRIDDLPLYNQDDDGNQAEQVKRLKREKSLPQTV